MTCERPRRFTIKETKYPNGQPRWVVIDRLKLREAGFGGGPDDGAVFAAEQMNRGLLSPNSLIWDDPE